MRRPGTVPTFFLGYDGGSRRRQGLWHTGDRVRVDEDGWLFFESRADDVIVSAGYRIGPVEVESTLLGHPAVREVAVIGEPDETRGELVVAVVVLRDGVEASDELAARAAGARQGRDRAVQVPAPGPLRRLAAEDHQRQDPPRRAPLVLTLSAAGDQTGRLRAA